MTHQGGKQLPWLILFLGCVPVAGSDTAPDEYLPGGAETCLMCHGDSSQWPATDILATPHGSSHGQAPFAEGNHNCQACHGPSAAHMTFDDAGQRRPPPVMFDDTAPVEVQNASCLDCHSAEVEAHWVGSAHQFEEVACVDCHRVHSDDPALNADTQTAVCTDCHRREQAEFLRSSSHPLMSGTLGCQDCHQPHGGGPAALTGTSINDTCFQCHAEKRGPFLWEHAPVREDCSHCHLPHGSNHDGLLQGRGPWLCQQCHQAQFHPSTLQTGTGLPPSGASQNMLGKNCMNCHTAVHGSNHPAGARLVR